MKPDKTEAEHRLDELRAETRHARERRDLYRAKSYGPRETSPERLRELERTCDAAEQRLRHAEAESERAPSAGAA